MICSRSVIEVYWNWPNNIELRLYWNKKDTVSIKIPFTIEANEELDKLRNSKRYYLDLGGKNIKKSEGDCIQSLYMMTKVLDQDKSKISAPVF